MPHSFSSLRWIPTLLIVVDILIFNQAAHAGAIQCGAVLRGPGIYTLDRDLTCPKRPYSAGLRVEAGATLNLNRHTLRCTGLEDGIISSKATVRNGAIVGCKRGVGAEGSVLERLTVTDGERGFGLGSDNRVVNCTALRHTESGFHMTEDSTNNVLLNNVANQNHIGFSLDESVFKTTMIGNSATANHWAGFSFYKVYTLLLAGNQARKNGAGFIFGRSAVLTIRGNVAAGNRQIGFVVDVNSQLDGNVAQGNGGDGFYIGDLDEDPRAGSVRLTNNYAIQNGGHGIHVIAERREITLKDNTALGQRAPSFDLADDSSTCQNVVWSRNTFGTKSRKCIR